MNDPLVIDLHMHGFEQITAAFVVRGRRTAVVETGPKSSVDRLLAGLRSAGVETVDWIVVTHIHLDHAGAAGTLAARWPQAKVAVHPVGAPHLANPARLWASAGRIYGAAMDALWGGIDPIAAERIVPFGEGDCIDLGGRRLTALETPGHAWHHNAWLDDAAGGLFCGDALGVSLPDSGLIRPATPPPEFDLETAVRSIERIRAAGASSLWLTHFGRHDSGAPGRDIGATCEEAVAALRRWEGWVRDARSAGEDLDAATLRVAQAAHGGGEGRLQQRALERLEHTSSYRMNTWGYIRYLDKGS